MTPELSREIARVFEAEARRARRNEDERDRFMDIADAWHGRALAIEKWMAARAKRRVSDQGGIDVSI